MENRKFWGHKMGKKKEALATLLSAVNRLESRFEGLESQLEVMQDQIELLTVRQDAFAANFDPRVIAPRQPERGLGLRLDNRAAATKNNSIYRPQFTK